MRNLLQRWKGRGQKRASPVQPGRLCFASSREDGLCMRINTILDTMLLARAFGGTHAFLWDESETPAVDQQTTDRAGAVFQAAYLARHRLMPADLPPRAPDLARPPRSDQDLADLLADGARSGLIWLDQPRDFGSFLPRVLRDLPPDAYAQAFDALGFAPGARAGIEAARALDVPPGSVAIHLRGGDILHGTHANMATYLHKAPSVPEIEALVARIGRQAGPIFLVGQEPEVQAALRAAHPHLRVLGQGFDRPVLDPVGAVLFDAVLMGRMAAIHGGNSGVTLLSRRLGGVPFTDIARAESLVPLADLLADPMAAPRWSGLAGAIRAHAYVKAVTAAPPADWTADHLRLIRLARQHRPASAFLPLLEIGILAALDSPEAAEALAARWLQSPLPPDQPADIACAFLLGGAHYFPVQALTPVLAHAGPDRPGLTLIAALTRHMDDPAGHPAAMVTAALSRAEAYLAPAPIASDLRAMLLRALSD